MPEPNLANAAIGKIAAPKFQKEWLACPFCPEDHEHRVAQNLKSKPGMIRRVRLWHYTVCDTCQQQLGTRQVMCEVNAALYLRS